MLLTAVSAQHSHMFCVHHQQDLSAVCGELISPIQSDQKECSTLTHTDYSLPLGDGPAAALLLHLQVGLAQMRCVPFIAITSSQRCQEMCRWCRWRELVGYGMGKLQHSRQLCHCRQLLFGFFKCMRWPYGGT
jgi:hypothetical protein